ncbi:hypothetical protein AVEN_56074-1 [Araneus ventricosus]|uniref:Uncharacterized protein n=1 Tax=Araneus ventricosus TaxID=182803 RepID=A0A4Y2WKD1_ARAVE|nr:hypothetical protein AVEN_56074-1 [Araneus ventricosus]
MVGRLFWNRRTRYRRQRIKSIKGACESRVLRSLIGRRMLMDSTHAGLLVPQRAFQRGVGKTPRNTPSLGCIRIGDSSGYLQANEGAIANICRTRKFFLPTNTI